MKYISQIIYMYDISNLIIILFTQFCSVGKWRVSIDNDGTTVEKIPSEFL